MTEGKWMSHGLTLLAPDSMDLFRAVERLPPAKEVALRWCRYTRFHASSPRLILDLFNRPPFTEPHSTGSTGLPSLVAGISRVTAALADCKFVRIDPVIVRSYPTVFSRKCKRRIEFLLRRCVRAPFSRSYLS
jgi:hypothetical protein